MPHKIAAAVALGLTLAGPVTGAAQSAAAQGWGNGWGRPGWQDPRWNGGRGWGGWDNRRGWDRWDRRRGRDNTGLIVGLGALAAVVAVAAASARRDRDRDRNQPLDGPYYPAPAPAPAPDVRRYDDPQWRDRASADCEQAALADARDRIGEAQLGRIDDVRRVGDGFTVRGSVRVVSAGRDDGFDDYDRYARPRSVDFTCRWDGAARDVRLNPVFASNF